MRPGAVRLAPTCRGAALPVALLAVIAASLWLAQGQRAEPAPGAWTAGEGRTAVTGESVPSMPSALSVGPALTVRAAPGAVDGAYAFIWPADGAIATSFGAYHIGLDIAADEGSEVRASRAGEVTFAGGDPCCDYGYHVIVQHDDGWSTLYGHLSKIEVAAGARVAQGTLLGLSGGTGKASGPHLHFELRADGVPVDPFPYLPPGRSLPANGGLLVSSGPAAVADTSAVDDAAVAPPAPEPGSRGDVLASALGWLAGQPALAGMADAGGCTAGALGGSQWMVTCPPPDDCPDVSICGTVVLICVSAERPRTIWLC